MNFYLLKGFIRQGPLTVQLTGACMTAAISPGSELRLENCYWYYPGDIIAYQRSTEDLVSHRFLGYVRGRGGWRVITRADNARRADAPAPVQSVLGRVTHVDGQPYQPYLRIRIRAFVGWTSAVLGWVGRRFVLSLRRHISG